ncbi:12001_t:CDS:2, partial [Entrophospora sp. SA101]
MSALPLASIGEFYIKSSASPSGNATLLAPAAQNLVVDVEHGGFFGGWSTAKEGTKAILATQKSDKEHDTYQLWKYDDGWIIHKQSSLCLEVENGKSGNRLLLHSRKSPNQAINQRWVFTNEGHIALQNNPKLVLEIKSSSAKDNAPIILSDSKSDPYVRVFHQSNTKEPLLATRVIDNELNPVWNEVHYLPVNHIGEKFILEVMDHNTITKHVALGQVNFEITRELVKEVGENTYEPNPNGIDVLSTQGQIHYKAKFFSLAAPRKLSPDFLANLKEKPFDSSTLFNVITLQSSDGSFSSSPLLANLFGYEKSEELMTLFRKHIKNERLSKVKESVCITSMVMWFLIYLFKDLRKEWNSTYLRAEQYIIKEAGGSYELEELIVSTGKCAIRDRFDIKVSEEIEITVTRVQNIIKYQNSDGSFKIDDNVAKLLGFESIEKLTLILTQHIKSHSSNSSTISKLEINVWITILVIYYLRLICIEHKKTWISQHEKAYVWLWSIFLSEEVESETFSTIKSFVKEVYDIQSETLVSDSKFETEFATKKTTIKSSISRSSQHEIEEHQKITSSPKTKIYTRKTVTIIIVRRFLGYQTSSGCYELSNQLSQSLGFSSSEEAKTQLLKHFSSFSRSSRLDVNIWSTAIMIWYLRYVLIDFRYEWIEYYNKSLKWLSSTVKDKETEEEVLEAARIFVKKRFEVEESTIQEVSSSIFVKHETITVETTKTITSKQNKDGSFHISDTLSGILDISSDTKSQSFTSTIQTYAVSERLKKTTTHYTWWTTAITITYLRLHASTHETIWKIHYENARKYLSEQIKDAELEEELLKTCFKLVEEKTTKKVTTGTTKVTGATSTIGSTISSIFGRHDTKSVETTKTIISKQTNEGSFCISDTLSEILDISSDTKSQSFTSTIQTYAVSERLKKTTTHYTWWTTAITISYLKIHASSHETTWKVHYEKARKYLSEQIKDVELEEELLKVCHKLVEEKTTKKVTTSSIGSTFSGFFGKHDTKSVETTKTIISKQTSEGSFHFSDTLSEILEISSDTKSQSFTSTIQTYAVSERLKKTTTHYTWWTTAITISYLRIHASSHETTWKVQCEKARKYLSEQIKDVELEEELLKTCTKIVEEKTTKKVTTTSSSTATQSYDKKGEGITSGVTSAIGSTFSGFFGKHDTKSVETTKTIISKQTSEGSFHISDTLSEILEISSDTKSQSFTSTIQTYAVSERLKKTTTHYTWWTTAITISYLRIHASSHETTWKVQYEKARKYLSEQIKDVELEEELLKTCTKIVEEKTTKKVTTTSSSTATQSCDTKGEKKHEEEHESIIGGVTSSIGSTFSGFFGKHDTKSVETTKTIISKQTSEGSFHISDTLSEILEISSDTKSQSFTSTIQTYAVSERLKKTTTHYTWWTTAITISYLKLHASSHETTWKVQYEKARKYLSEQIKDVELEEELLKTCTKIVEEKTTKKVTTTSSSTATQSYDKKGEKKHEEEGIVSGVASSIGSTFSGFFGKHDTKSVETTKTIISKQTSEGSFHISDTLSEILEISSDTKSQSFTSTIQTYAVSERLKKTTTHYTWWTTAITISYLRIHASSHETTWKVQYEKARKYLSEQIKDVELEEELLKTCTKIVEEKTTKKVTATSSSTATQSYDKKGEGITSGVTSTIGSTFSGFFGKHDTKSVETTKTVISKQTSEGSFHISDTLSEILDISSDTKSQSFTSTIQTYAVSERLKKTTTHYTWWTTAITISYLKIHASSHETTWK